MELDAKSVLVGLLKPQPHERHLAIQNTAKILCFFVYEFETSKWAWKLCCWLNRYDPWDYRQRDVGRGRLAATFNWFWPLKVAKSETGSGISKSQGPWSSFLFESLSRLARSCTLQKRRLGCEAPGPQWVLRKWWSLWGCNKQNV